MEQEPDKQEARPQTQEGIDVTRERSIQDLRQGIGKIEQRIQGRLQSDEKRRKRGDMVFYAAVVATCGLAIAGLSYRFGVLDGENKGLREQLRTVGKYEYERGYKEGVLKLNEKMKEEIEKMRKETANPKTEEQGQENQEQDIYDGRLRDDLGEWL